MQRMHLRYAMENGFNGFSACAAKYAWRPSPSLSPLPLPHGERKDALGLERKNAGTRDRSDTLER